MSLSTPPLPFSSRSGQKQSKRTSFGPFSLKKRHQHPVELAPAPASIAPSVDESTGTDDDTLVHLEPLPAHQTAETQTNLSWSHLKSVAEAHPESWDEYLRLAPAQDSGEYPLFQIVQEEMERARQMSESLERICLTVNRLIDQCEISLITGPELGPDLRDDHHQSASSQKQRIAWSKCFQNAVASRDDNEIGPYPADPGGLGPGSFGDGLSPVNSVSMDDTGPPGLLQWRRPPPNAAELASSAPAQAQVQSEHPSLRLTRAAQGTDPPPHETGLAPLVRPDTSPRPRSLGSEKPLPTHEPESAAQGNHDEIDDDGDALKGGQPVPLALPAGLTTTEQAVQTDRSDVAFESPLLDPRGDTIHLTHTARPLEADTPAAVPDADSDIDMIDDISIDQTDDDDDDDDDKEQVISSNSDAADAAARKPGSNDVNGAAHLSQSPGSGSGSGSGAFSYPAFGQGRYGLGLGIRPMSGNLGVLGPASRPRKL
ncbi:uncharacterized protein BJ171DRAFT_519371 [Polychytrium aggregatum]|uniref:uncharacterized protein n=1 Tax=Polychytrium aggregatum TaxID=110093 RepID=UPI0022FF1ECE|nr:uncharacterized protein BJ171DRAFT_519371 [Polychytrium aggregatum]KAI9199284.1 hypothetical protein BJ171DRAFT_519371 [Polychytrium aggregatum]